MLLTVKVISQEKIPFYGQHHQNTMQCPNQGIKCRFGFFVKDNSFIGQDYKSKESPTLDVFLVLVSVD